MVLKQRGTKGESGGCMSDLVLGDRDFGNQGGETVVHAVREHLEGDVNGGDDEMAVSRRCDQRRIVGS